MAHMQCYQVTLILADMNTISQECQACKLGSLISNLAWVVPPAMDYYNTENDPSILIIYCDT